MPNIVQKNAVKSDISNDGIRMAKWLTYAGTLPLMLCVIGLMLTKVNLAFHQIASAYAGVIIGFLGGIHWAVYLFFADKCRINLLVWSNIVALAAWLSLLIHPMYVKYIIQLVCFGILLIFDYKLAKLAILPEWFWKVRRNATLIVGLSLILLLSISISQLLK